MTGHHRRQPSLPPILEPALHRDHRTIHSPRNHAHINPLRSEDDRLTLQPHQHKGSTIPLPVLQDQPLATLDHKIHGKIISPGKPNNSILFNWGHDLVSDWVTPCLAGYSDGAGGEVPCLLECDANVDANAVDFDDVGAVTVEEAHLVQNGRLAVNVGVFIEMLQYATGSHKVGEAILEARQCRSEVLPLGPVGVPLRHLRGA